MVSSFSSPTLAEVDVEAAGAECPKLVPVLEAGAALVAALMLPNASLLVVGADEAMGTAGVGNTSNENAAVVVSFSAEGLAEKKEFVLPIPPHISPDVAFDRLSSFSATPPPNASPSLVGAFADPSFVVAPALLTPKESGALDADVAGCGIAAGADIEPNAEKGAGVGARLETAVAVVVGVNFAPLYSFSVAPSPTASPLLTGALTDPSLVLAPALPAPKESGALDANVADCVIAVEDDIEPTGKGASVDVRLASETAVAFAAACLASIVAAYFT